MTQNAAQKSTALTVTDPAIPAIPHDLSTTQKVSYLSDMGAFFAKLREQGIDPRDVTGDVVRLYKEALVKANDRKSTIARHLSVIRGVYEQFGKTIGI